MDSIEIKIGDYPVIFTKQSVSFSGSEFFYGKMSNITHHAEPIPCYEFTYEGVQEKLFYNEKSAKVVNSVFQQVIALNQKKEASAVSEPVKTAVSAEPAAPAVTENTETHMQQIQETPVSEPTFTSEPAFTEEASVLDEPPIKKTGSKKKVVINIIIAVVLVAIVAGIVVFTQRKHSDSEPVPQESTPATTEPVAAPADRNSYEEGTYQVGTDLPEGVYLIEGSGYLSVSSDGSSSLDSVITNANYTNRTFIQVENGQYLTFQGTAKAVDKAEPYANTDVLTDGMYLAGKDFPAGEYTLTAEGDAYVAIMTDAKGVIDSITSNFNFSNTETITVEDGQFLELKNCRIEL